MRTILFACILFASLAGTAFAAQPPSANAGPDLFVTSGSYNSNPSAILQGSGYDPNGATINFYWTCTDGSLSANNVPRPLFTAPSGIWQSAVYTCTLTITNNYGLSASDSATVFVNHDNNNNFNYNLNLQTNPATDNYNGQATLNANLLGSSYPYGTIYAWFQWGTTTSYGFESVHNPVGYVGQFNQHIANLLPNTTYHFRAVAQQNNGNIIYGQDLVFNSQGYIPINNPINIPQVLGATTVSTGLTNNLLADSFFLPLLIIIASLWLYFSGGAGSLLNKLKSKIKG